MIDQKSNNGAALGFEAKLWRAADKLRGNMDAAEYKHFVLGLIFLKYISDSFEEKYKEIQKENEDPEDRDYYLAENIFWVPKKARWESLQSNAHQPTIGKTIDDAMDAIEHENKELIGVLPKDYSKPSLDKSRLGELIDLIGTICLGDKEGRSKDILGRVYEYFLGQFASAEGKKGGQFYTPKSIVNLLVEMLEPFKGRVFDPCCGSGGMFVQSEKFVQMHSGRLDNISIYGQESNQTTWKLCKMNLAIRRIDSSKVIWNSSGSFLKDAHPDLKADFIIANPPFNDSDWSGDQLKDDARWKFGPPPSKNANFAWVQHFIHHLSPTGIAGFVLANASLSATRNAESEIRKNIIEADLVDCIVILPKQLFYNTMIPACLWFISRDKKNNSFRDRKGEILFIDARKFGKLIDRKHKELSDDEIKQISKIYHDWRNKKSSYSDINEFCKSVKIDDIRGANYDLTPIRYIKINLPKSYPSDLDSKMVDMSKKLDQRAADFKDLENSAKDGLQKAGYKLFDKTHFGYASNVYLADFIKNIFIKWFINFDFPDKNNRPYKSNGGKLTFSKEFEQKIPAGWSVIPLTDVVKVIDCLHTKKPDFTNSENILLQFYNVGEFGLLDLNKIYTVSKDDYKIWTKNILLTEGDCILTNAGLTGAAAQIPHDFHAGLGRNITALRPEKITPSYLIEYILSDYGEKQIRRNLDIGTIFDTLNVKGIKKFVILVPPADILKKFEEIARPLRKIMEKNAYENLTLSPKDINLDFLEEDDAD
ncbi:MAG: N-6 DNA methylase [Candidatus Micrarchaeales archaeon]|nr:N-6 DNA methylase [Candidatus Micrarchaeales archaeon]